MLAVCSGRDLSQLNREIPHRHSTKLMRRGVAQLALAAACGLLFAAACVGPDRKQQRAPAVPSASGELVVNRYGFADAGLRIDTIIVPRGTTLSVLLQQHGVASTYLQQIALGALKGVCAPQKIRAGNTSFFWYDADSAARHWIYMHSPAEYLHLDFTGDTLKASINRFPVETKQRSIHTVITSSLWNAMAAANTSPELALRLADIFAWTVDFFGLEKGDQFFACYDEELIDSVPIGLGRIHAAQFVHGRDTIGAYGFVQDSTFAYWDQQGRSLRKAFLKAPLKFSRISSGFSYGRLHPILKIVRPHTGIDYAAPAGTPVLALGDGKVIARGFKGGGGNTIKIRHNSVYTTGYLHLSRFAKGVEVGTRVKQGQVIGYVGSTGMATGPHLDFRVWRNGSPMNPLRLESPSVAPLDSALHPAFKAERARLDSLLNLAEKQMRVTSEDTTKNRESEW